MSRNSQDRSEEPIGGAQARAGKLGLRPASPDLPFVAGALGFCIGALAVLPRILHTLPRILSLWWSSIAETATGSLASVPRTLQSGAGSIPILSLLVSFSIPFLLSFVATIAVALFQRSPGPRTEGQKRPRFSRRPFLSLRSPGQPTLGYRMLRTLAVIVLLTAATVPLLRYALPGSSLFVSRNPQTLLAGLLTPGALFLGMLLLLLLALSLVDREYRRRLLLDALKLDPSQAREERRLAEGDSGVRLAMRRRLATRLRDATAPSPAAISIPQAVQRARGSASGRGGVHV